MGTKKESFIQLTERINRTTGGVSVYPFVTAVKGSPDPIAFLMVRYASTEKFERSGSNACLPLAGMDKCRNSTPRVFYTLMISHECMTMCPFNKHEVSFCSDCFCNG